MAAASDTGSITLVGEDGINTVDSTKMGVEKKPEKNLRFRIDSDRPRLMFHLCVIVLEQKVDWVMLNSISNSRFRRKDNHMTALID